MILSSSSSCSLSRSSILFWRDFCLEGFPYCCMIISSSSSSIIIYLSLLLIWLSIFVIFVRIESFPPILLLIYASAGSCNGTFYGNFFVECFRSWPEEDNNFLLFFWGIDGTFAYGDLYTSGFLFFNSLTGMITECLFPRLGRENLLELITALADYYD